MLRFLTRLAGPIFAKEMVEMARRRRHFVNRVLYGLVLLLVLFLIWQDHNNYGRYRYLGGPSIQQAAEMAEALFNGVVIVQYVAVFLFVPLFLAGVIASEREERTLDLLLTTRLRDREIVLGKLSSRVVVLVLLIFSGLPVLSLILLLGGVDPLALARCTAATLLAVLFVAAHAIYFSAITRSPIAALVRTFWWLTVLLVGVPAAVALVLAGVLDAFPWNIQMQVMYIAGGLALFVNPIGAFVAALNPDEFVFVERVVGEWYFAGTFVAPAAWSAFLIWRAVARLRADPVPLRFPSLGRLGRLWRAFLETPEDSPRRRYGFKVPNPLWQRSRVARVYDREGIIGRIQWAAWAAALFFFLLVVFFDTRSLDDDDCGMAFLGLTWVALAALTVTFAATSLVGDRRRGFLEQVLVTPLTGREVVDGTLLAVWQHMLRVAWLPVMLGLMFVSTTASPPLGMAGSLVTAFLVCVLFAVHGVACSLAARTFPGALVPAFLFPVLITIGTLPLIETLRDESGVVLLVVALLALVVGWLWSQRQPGPAAVSIMFMGLHLTLANLATGWIWWNSNHGEMAIAYVNPIYWVIVLLQKHSRHWPMSAAAWHTALVCYWLALATSIILMRWWLAANFDRLVERAAGTSSAFRPTTTPSAHAAPAGRPIAQPGDPAVFSALPTGDGSRG